MWLPNQFITCSLLRVNHSTYWHESTAVFFTDKFISTLHFQKLLNDWLKKPRREKDQCINRQFKQELNVMVKNISMQTNPDTTKKFFDRLLNSAWTTLLNYLILFNFNLEHIFYTSSSNNLWYHRGLSQFE